MTLYSGKKSQFHRDLLDAFTIYFLSDKKLIDMIFTGKRWDREGGAGVVLLDVLNMEHTEGVQRCLLRGGSG